MTSSDGNYLRGAIRIFFFFIFYLLHQRCWQVITKPVNVRAGICWLCCCHRAHGTEQQFLRPIGDAKSENIGGGGKKPDTVVLFYIYLNAFWGDGPLNPFVSIVTGVISSNGHSESAVVQGQAFFFFFFEESVNNCGWWYVYADSWNICTSS